MNDKMVSFGTTVAAFYSKSTFSCIKLARPSRTRSILFIDIMECPLRMSRAWTYLVKSR
jgi:hypothetical protein